MGAQPGVENVAPETPSAARESLERVLTTQRWPGDVDAALIAAHEALINADRHGGGIRHMRTVVDATTLVVEVADYGEGFDPAAYTAHEPDLLAERGRGLWLMNTLADAFDVLREPAGSRVILRFSVDAPPVLAAPDPPSRPRPLPHIDELGELLAESLGAAVLVIDQQLVVREARAAQPNIFPSLLEHAVGKDVRGLVAEMKHWFLDPASFEDRMLHAFAHLDERRDDLLLRSDGRLLRHTSTAIRREGSVVGYMSVYMPVTEQTQLIAAVQRSMLPPTPSWTDLEIGAIYHPAEASIFVGGDFYDFIELSAGGRCILVGDVSGRGTDAAAASTNVRAFLRAALATHGVTSAIPNLEDALREEFAEEEFVTLGMCVQESQDIWSYTSCGHEPALLLRDGQLQKIAPRGTVLGFGFLEEWVREPFRLIPGDLLLLYTDGVIDAGRGQHRFGFDRLCDALVELAHLPPQELVDAVDARLHDFSGNQANDDHVLLAARRL